MDSNLFPKSNKMSIAYIIVNFNSYDYVKDLIESKNKVLSGSIEEIIIVDNNSRGNKIENITNVYPDIKLYVLNDNIGFSGANNLAVEKSNAEYIVFVNPDVLFTEDCINPIISFLEKNENVGACGPMLLNEDLTFQNSTGFKMGLLYDFAEAFFLISLFRKLYNFRYKRAAKYKFPCKVSWLSAALIIMKKDVFEEIGGFDTTFFLNYEDIDLCMRLQKKGYKNYYFPYLECIHYSHHSFRHDYDLLVCSRYASRRIYARKHYNKIYRIIVSVIHVVGLLIRLLIVFLFYSGVERMQRRMGYMNSLKLYFCNK